MVSRLVTLTSFSRSLGKLQLRSSKSLQPNAFVAFVVFETRLASVWKRLNTLQSVCKVFETRLAKRFQTLFQTFSNTFQTRSNTFTNAFQTLLAN